MTHFEKLLFCSRGNLLNTNLCFLWFNAGFKQKLCLLGIIKTTLLCLIVVGGYIAFSQIFHSQNHFIMTLSFYQNVKLGPTPRFCFWVCLSLASSCSTWPKSQDKNLNILAVKRAFKMKKAFYIIFKGLSLKQIKQFFWKVRIWF